jgi:hypothetical protein
MAENTVALQTQIPNTLEARLAEIQQTIQGTRWLIGIELNREADHNLSWAMDFADKRLKEIERAIAKLLSERNAVA